ncbi:hypothetical protein WCO01_07240 [Weissella confusa]|nr:hypothetical protein C6P09_06830 [Weissella confusa]GEO55522.1 hypothetical protein WCO01_07240 [Weissella confusa]
MYTKTVPTTITVRTTNEVAATAIGIIEINSGIDFNSFKSAKTIDSPRILIIKNSVVNNTKIALPMAISVSRNLSISAYTSKTTQKIQKNEAYDISERKILCRAKFILLAQLICRLEEAVRNNNALIPNEIKSKYNIFFQFIYKSMSPKVLDVLQYSK